MKNHVILILLVSFVGMFGLICFVEAGFGVSPPWVKNNYLTPGSRFEQIIYLSRGTPDQELMAQISIDAPEIKDWITIEKGLRFPLPIGVKQFPMKVIVDVPSDAAYGSYQGYIRVKAISSGQPGQVATILGARIDVDLIVTEKGFADFRLKGAPFIADIEKGNPLVVLMVLENIGNTRIGPSKINLDIYDISHQRLLRSGEITEVELVEPFETKQVGGEMPIDLGLGEYWADVTIYKEGESLGVSKVHFRIVPYVEKTELLTEKGKKGVVALLLPYVGIVIILLIVVALIQRTRRGIFTRRRKKKPGRKKKI
jgi:hypothetical protein